MKSKVSAPVFSVSPVSQCTSWLDFSTQIDNDGIIEGRIKRTSVERFLRAQKQDTNQYLALENVPVLLGDQFEPPWVVFTENNVTIRWLSMYRSIDSCDEFRLKHFASFKHSVREATFFTCQTPIEHPTRATLLSKGVILDARMVGSGLATVIRGKLGKILVLIARDATVPVWNLTWQSKHMSWDCAVLYPGDDMWVRLCLLYFPLQTLKIYAATFGQQRLTW